MARQQQAQERQHEAGDKILNLVPKLAVSATQESGVMSEDVADMQSARKGTMKPTRLARRICTI